MGHSSKILGGYHSDHPISHRGTSLASSGPRIQSVKQGLLQGLVVGRWIPRNHILLINLCLKTLRLRASVSERWRKT